jgi:glycosyltransferase involved in cell wall biosynthesis
MSVLFLRDRIGWFGSHTGYEQLTRYIVNGVEPQVVAPRRGQVARYLGSAYARLHGRSGRGAADLSEFEFRLRRRFSHRQVSHILYLEDHLALLKTPPPECKPIVGTIHLPPSVLKPEQCEPLSRLNLTLVLNRRNIPFFEQFAGKGRVRFIHHGADTEFFKPDLLKPPQLRILYSGVYLRNEAMLSRVVPELAKRNPDLRFDLLVPKHHQGSAALAPLQNHPSVTWHAGLNDEQLRDLYQKSYLMLLPMNDSGANTAVVEALTSGLPIVTTDVGGIRDYAGGDILPVVANNDDVAMIALVEQYITQPKWRDEVGRRCRKFAEQTLAWPLVAQKHVETYRELME